MSAGVWTRFHHGVISLSAPGMDPMAFRISPPQRQAAGSTLLPPGLDQIVLSGTDQHYNILDFQQDLAPLPSSLSGASISLI